MRTIIVMFKNKRAIKVILHEKIKNHSEINDFVNTYFTDYSAWGEANFHFKCKDDPEDKEQLPTY